jgi:hypothetical protein
MRPSTPRHFISIDMMQRSGLTAYQMRAVKEKIQGMATASRYFAKWKDSEPRQLMCGMTNIGQGSLPLNCPPTGRSRAPSSRLTSRELPRQKIMVMPPRPLIRTKDQILAANPYEMDPYRPTPTSMFCSVIPGSRGNT